VVVNTAMDAFALATACPAGATCANVTLFDPAKSSTFQATGGNFTGDNFPYNVLSGANGADTVAFGGITYPAAAIGLATAATNPHVFEVTNDGQLPLSLGAAKGWWAGPAANWSAREFGLYLRPYEIGVRTMEFEDAEAGELTMGCVRVGLADSRGINAGRVDGEVTYYPVVASADKNLADKWTIGEVRLGGGGGVGTPRTAVIDSFVDVIWGPEADIAAFYTSLGAGAKNASGLWIVKEGPGLGAGIHIGGDTYLLPDGAMCMTPGKSAEELVANGLVQLQGENGTWCPGMVQPLTSMLDAK
jgi:hypothetical protein